MRRGGAGPWVLAVLLGCIAALVLSPAALAATGSISGEVTEAKSKLGLPGVAVAVLSERGKLVEFKITPSTGTYKIEGLAPGSYKVEFIDLAEEKFTTQYYKNVHIPENATLVKVKEGATTESINAELREGGTISGAVEGPSKGPLGNAEVVVFGTVEGRPYFKEAKTDTLGKYSVLGLPAGSYQVEFFPPSGVNLVPQYYQEASSLSLAKTVAVEEEKQYENINAKLVEGGKISGTVTDAATHKPVAHVLVAAENDKGLGFFGGFAETNANGEYTVVGLGTGSYELEVFSESGEYLTGFVNGVSVAQGQTTPAINVALVRRAPVNTVPPILTGTPAVGQSLSCSTGTWTGSTPFAFTYAWLRDGSAIGGASANAYVVQSADQGHVLRCQVTATNSVSHATATSNTVDVPPAPPPPTPSPSSPPPSPPPAPTIENVTQSHSSWSEGNKVAAYSRKKKPPVGTTISFVLNEQATVSFVFTQQLSGRKVGGTCVAETNKNRRKPACKRMVSQGTLSFGGHGGMNKLVFQGRLSSTKRLPLGAYTLRITAVNSVGQRSSPRTLNFTIVK
jgi:hypothetical protein